MAGNSATDIIEFRKISAKEAWEETQKNAKERTKYEINEIFRQIHAAINNGEDYITLDHYISDEAEKFLKELCYNVEMETWTRESTDYSTYISWRE